MRIALVSLSGSPTLEPGGQHSGFANAYVAGLAPALNATGHDVTVLTLAVDAPVMSLPKATGFSRQRSYEIVELPASGTPSGGPLADAVRQQVPAIAAEIAGSLRARHADVIVTVSWPAALAVAAATRDSELAAIPVVSVFDGSNQAARPDSSGPDSAGLGRLRQALAAAATTAVATSTSAATRLVGPGLARSAVPVVPAGIDTATFDRSGPSATTRNLPRVVTAGRLPDGMAMDGLLRIISRIPAVELVVCGGPEPAELSTDAEVRRLMAAAETLGIAKRVTFSGRLPRSRLAEVFRSAELYVDLSGSDSFGMSAVEAMACGTPVLGFDVGGLTDTVVDGVTGRLLPVGDMTAAMRVLASLHNDPFALQAMGHAAADRASARYPWRRVAEELNDVLTSAFGQSVPGPELADIHA